MPLTPFHLGPALLIGYLFRRRLDLGTFLLANVVTDVRAVLVFFGLLPEPLHGPFHQTYLGAFAVALGTAGFVLLFARQWPQTARSVSTRPDSVSAVVLASVAGTWLHTTLDAFLHPDMRPFYPLFGNPLYGLANESTSLIIYGVCVLAGLISVEMIGFSAIQQRWQGTTMTPWRIVASSALVGLGLGIAVGLYSPGVGALVAGLSGGLVAGYLPASGLKSGCWFGLLAGAMNGVGIAIVSFVQGLVFAGGAPAWGIMIIVIGIDFLLTATVSVIFGGIGATVYRLRTIAL